MQKLVLFFCLMFSAMAVAQEESIQEQETITQETQEAQNNLVESQEAQEEIDPLAPTEEDIKEEINVSENNQLPSCNDEKMLEQVRAILTNYAKEKDANSMYEKRLQKLKLKFAQSFNEEEVAGFTSKKNVVVADALVMTKINEGLADEDIRLCKSTVETDRFEPIYVMMYKNKHGGIKLSVLNYSYGSQDELTINFE